MSSIVVAAIRFYQRVAPARIRRSCRFEPSCSNYMIEAVQKYGIFVGLKKGILRLSRCRVPHGGIDSP